MRLLGWLACGMLAACASAPERAGDHVTVVWNRVGNVQQVCQDLEHRKEVWAIRGCSKWDAAGAAGERVCSIYAPAPRSETDTQSFVTLGHELLHCFDGNWHDRWGRMNPDESQAAVGGSRPRREAAAAN
jgi:hypothetical protein